jgi:uncharacterized protein (DUF934 family)
MPKLIKGRTIVDDPWSIVDATASFAEIPADVPVLVPLALWTAHRPALQVRGGVGVWLAPADDPAALATDLAVLPVIAVEFPSFADGRGYSTARLLRERHGYTGELRAIGDVLRDQLFALAECGFDAFALRADRDAASALRGFDDFCAGVYAPTARTPRPWFRRRNGTAHAASALPDHASSQSPGPGISQGSFR